MVSETPESFEQTQIVPLSSSGKIADLSIKPGLNAGIANKQERDLAFAVAAVNSGQITRKQLAQAVKDWTIHGDVSLPEHLVKKGLIAEDLRSPLEDDAESRLQRVLDHLSDRGSDSVTSYRESLIRLIDTSGRIAGVLGMSVNILAEADSLTRTSAGRFQLMKKIGQGGLGVVWLARDEKLKRIVAIKEILRQASTDSPEVRRFQREAEITGRLEHPSIVPLYQYGFDEETDQPYYVMRYIGKRTLDHAIDEYHERRRGSDGDSLRLHYLLNSFVSVCQAIAYAHSKNVIHRDLKPENVALDNYGQVIVLDWGLAKLTGEYELIESYELGISGEGTGNNQTQDGQVLGTPMFMAPEQASGRIEEIDERTDVYGLGAVLYAILTGFGPHEKTRETLTANSQVSELLRKIVSEPPTSVRSLNPKVPPELEAIADKALALKPYARYQSALELADEIQHWLAGEPVAAYREPWKKRASRWIAQHRITTRIAGALLTMLLVGGMSFGVATSNAIVAERQSHFEGLKSEAREIESTIEARADVLARNTRFMAGVPPVTAIAAIRNGTPLETGETEEVWNGRLTRIYSGLLASNPNYLSVTYLEFDPSDKSADSATELVRVERHKSTGSIQSIPAARLRTLDETSALSAIRQLNQGDVHLEETRLEEAAGAETSRLDSVALGGIPVFHEETGELFGAVVIETDLEQGLRQMLEGSLRSAETGYVVNSNHHILLHYGQEDGYHSSSRGQDCGILPLNVQKYLKDTEAPDNYTDGENVIVQKIRMNDTPDSDWIALVLMLEAE